MPALSRIRQHEVLALLAVAALTFGCSGVAESASRSPGATSSVATESPAASTPLPTSSSAPPSTSPGGIENVPPAQGTLSAVWIGEGQVIAVGGYQGAAFKPAILVYQGGAWSVADTPDAGGQVMAVTQLGGRLVAVGNELPDARNGFIWTSQDGRIWKEAKKVPGAVLYDVVATHDVAVAVGASLDAEMTSTAAAWTSTDGTQWAKGAVGSASLSSIRAVTVWPSGFAAAGDAPHDRTRPIWKAVDPAAWTSLKTDLSPPLLVLDAQGWSSGLAVGGATDKSGNQHPFVALSGDGRTWKRTNLSTAAEGYVSALGLAGETLVATGVDADRLTLWTLSGAKWQPETIEPTGASIGGLAWTPEFGLLGVGAKDGNQALWVLRDH
jgi:hypothetical protein